ncbi:MAG TPA: dsRBD fold-containing protein [Acidimicrobiales bacterium]|nr:dsRBD fold-containing protein [Acidimicrobiales bacterium]
MKAHVGDRLIVDSNKVGRARQTGEIVEVVSDSSVREHYRVRWSDGRESFVYPGSDATIEAVASTTPAKSAETETRSVLIEMRLQEDTSHCRATATMQTSIGAFVGTGEARRHPADPIVPMIGEELAVARALVDLAQLLEAAAREEIAAGAHRDRHLVG